MLDKYGEIIYRELEASKRKYKKWTREELEGIISKYTLDNNIGSM